VTHVASVLHAAQLTLELHGLVARDIELRLKRLRGGR